MEVENFLEDEFGLQHGHFSTDSTEPCLLDNKYLYVFVFVFYICSFEQWQPLNRSLQKAVQWLKHFVYSSDVGDDPI